MAEHANIISHELLYGWIRGRRAIVSTSCGRVEAARPYYAGFDKHAWLQQFTCRSRRALPVLVPRDGSGALAAQPNFLHAKKGKRKTQFTGLRASSRTV